MLRFRDGDEKAFDELVANNIRKVHALVYRFLGSPTEVEDITQEVFLRLYRTATRYVPTAKFSTYLYRIVANLCFNALRSKRKTHFRQIRHDHMRAAFLEAPGCAAAIHSNHQTKPALPPRGHARHGVLDDHGAGWLDREPLRSLHENIRRGFAFKLEHG